MNTLTTVNSPRFFMAIAAAWIISLSLTCVAAVSDFLPGAEKEAQSMALFDPVDNHRHGATMMASESEDVRFAPREQMSAEVISTSFLNKKSGRTGSPFADRVRR